MQKQPLKENYKHDDSSTNQKQLSREEKLRLWLEAKKIRQKSTTYSSNNRSFQELLRVYDSPKLLMKSATCKKEFSSSSSRNDKENLNLSFLSVTNPQISETSCDSESSPLFMSPIPPKRLSDIQDENEKSTDKSQNSPHFGFLNSSENRKRTPDFIEIKEDLQEDSLLKLPQLKKLLTEENQLSTLKPEIPAFSFQETPLPNSNNLLKPIKESQEEEDLQRLGEEKNSELEQKELEKPLINKTPEKEKKYHEKDREESKGNNTDNSAYVYSYSMKKANKKLSEEYGIEKVITPIKSSSRKKTSHSLKICIGDLKSASKLLYIPHEMEESFPAANETCILIKEFLKSNSKVQIGRKDHSVSKENSKITTLDEITKIIDADINNNGNYALLELSVEKARKMKLGTRKILTPLKQFGMDDQGKDSTKKEDISVICTGKTEKDFGYLPYDQNLIRLLQKTANEEKK